MLVGTETVLATALKTRIELELFNNSTHDPQVYALLQKFCDIVAEEVIRHLTVTSVTNVQVNTVTGTGTLV